MSDIKWRRFDTDPPSNGEFWLVVAQLPTGGRGWYYVPQDDEGNNADEWPEWWAEARTDVAPDDYPPTPDD
jgi:hypothetical protein